MDLSAFVRSIFYVDNFYHFETGKIYIYYKRAYI